MKTVGNELVLACIASCKCERVPTASRILWLRRRMTTPTPMKVI